VSSVKYEKRKPKKDPLRSLGYDLAKLLKEGIDLGALKSVSVTFSDPDGKIVKMLQEAVQDMSYVNLEKELCVEAAIDGNAYKPVLKIEIKSLEFCSSRTLLKALREMQSYYRKLLKEETWIKELPEGGDGQ